MKKNMYKVKITMINNLRYNKYNNLYLQKKKKDYILLFILNYLVVSY